MKEPSFGDRPPVSRNGASWESILRAPTHGQHLAQLYTERDVLVRAVGEFAGAGLRRGEAALLVVTAAHRQPIVRQLEGHGFELEDLEGRGQLTLLDAASTLPGLLVGGLPDRELPDRDWGSGRGGEGRRIPASPAGSARW